MQYGKFSCKAVKTSRLHVDIILGNNYVVLMDILLFTVHNVLDVFQYLTDLEVNTTVNDSLISEVCLIVIIL